MICGTVSRLLTYNFRLRLTGPLLPPGVFVWDKPTRLSSGWEGLSQSEWVTSSFRFLNSLKHYSSSLRYQHSCSQKLQNLGHNNNNNNNNTTTVIIPDTVEVRMPTCSDEKDGEHRVSFGGSPIQRIPAIRNILPKFLVPLPIHILYSLTAAF